LAPAHSSRKAAGKIARHSILCVDLLPKRGVVVGVKKWGSSQVRSQNASMKMEWPRDADACTVGIARQCRGKEADVLQPVCWERKEELVELQAGEADLACLAFHLPTLGWRVETRGCFFISRVESSRPSEIEKQPRVSTLHKRVGR